MNQLRLLLLLALVHAWVARSTSTCCCWRDSPCLAHTLAVFEDCPVVDGIVLVGGQDRIAAYRQMVRDFGVQQGTRCRCRRQYPPGIVREGLGRAADADIVIVHDGARPLVTAHVIAETVAAAKVHGAAIVAVPVKDTIKQGDAEGFVTSNARACSALAGADTADLPHRHPAPGPERSTWRLHRYR